MFEWLAVLFIHWYMYYVEFYPDRNLVKIILKNEDIYPDYLFDSSFRR